MSVRTLRHYHQIGLLEEPERSVNRYRKYTVHHLAKLLRITKFTDLGIPLSEVHRVIDDPEATNELLATIDAQAAVEIDQLQHRRRRIAELGGEGATPDLPESLLPYASMLLRHGSASPSQRQYEREQLALVTHLSDDPNLPWLVAATARLAASNERYLAVVDRFVAIGPDAGPSETDPVVDEMVALLSNAVDVAQAPPFSRQGTALLLAHQRSHLNAAQHRIIDRIAEVLEAQGTEPTATS